MTTEQPFPLFHGWDSRQAEAAEVFAFSVYEHASIPVELHAMKLADLPIKRRGVTEFSYGRFCVPWWQDYEGVAAFFDGCDQLCLGDVAELAAIPMDGCAVKVVKHKRGEERRPRSWSSVMLMDCSWFGAWTPGYIERCSDEELMRFTSLADSAIGELPAEWNTLVMQGEEPPAGAKLAHWSCLSDPNGTDWISRSGSRIWAAARERWRAAA